MRAQSQVLRITASLMWIAQLGVRARIARGIRCRLLLRITIDSLVRKIGDSSISENLVYLDIELHS